MGNNGSSSREQQAASICSIEMPTAETNRGWSQSFPRELAKHRAQPPAARKVLPEPPVQRLRATDNGSIIHNGGTISGRRVPTFALTRDVAKRDEPSFRGRSGSTSNIVEHRLRRFDRHCCRYRADWGRPDAPACSANLKRCGSEPDLRASPDVVRSSIHERPSPAGSSGHRDEARCASSCYRHGKESKERLECKYRAKKKYKAPAPPTSSGGDFGDGSAVVGESAGSRDLVPRSIESKDQPSGHQQVQPPPRRSRLFKTRVESKKAQVSWQQLSSGVDRAHARIEQPLSSTYWDDGSRPLGGQNCNDEATGKIVVDKQDRDLARRLNVDERRRRSRLADHGKDTLQRSMSSPEFQAELIQVAKRVRDKLEFGGRAIAGQMPINGCDRPDEKVDRRDRRCGDRTTERPLDGKIVPDEANQRHAAVDVNRRRQSTEEEKSWNGTPVPASSNPRVAAQRQRSLGNKENLDPGLRSDQSKAAPTKQLLERRLADALTEKSKARSNSHSGETKRHDHEKRIDEESSQPFSATSRPIPKTFYFGMNERPPEESRNETEEDQDAARDLDGKAELRDRESDALFADTCVDTDDDNSNVVENISLSIRPTLPKKQLEIPRFSPSAAWRLLSALEAPGPSVSTASEEMPLMFEERIERLSRPPPLFPLPLPLGPRSWHDKSGDSGISGDAGAANDDSLDVSTNNRMKPTATRPSWTPQQDLGEESSSDAGVDSPPPLPAPLKYHPPRAHVFSLSLPRDDAKGYLSSQGSKPREGSAFNSLQKLKRSVSGAFGLSTHDQHQRKCTRDVLDDNWLLSSSAPTSLQHNQVRVEAAPMSPSGWRPFPSNDDDDVDGGVDDDMPEDEEEDEDEDEVEVDDDMPEDEDEEEDEDENDARFQTSKSRNLKSQANDFPVIMKPPSFSYLTPAGHVMYLPETNEAEHRAQNLSGRKVIGANASDFQRSTTGRNSFRFNDYDGATRRDSRLERVDGAEGQEAERTEEETEGKEENIDKGRKKRKENASRRERENLGSTNDSSENAERSIRHGRVENSVERPTTNLWRRVQPSLLETKGSKSRGKSGSKSKRFTFQSTVRQIERRRIAEKLSKEVEAKERQRKGELEAMRKVEEEFQRKRAKEKANIRQQLRLFKQMEENFNNLPSPDWDGSQLSRAEPDGAPSSVASSPTLMPAGNLSTAATGRPSSGDESRRKKDVAESDSKERLGERKCYRPKYYDWSPDTTSHSECKQTTVHPKIVCDIPKSSPVFVDANANPGSKPGTTSSTPRSDNYRKDFAHGTVASRTCFASSDSELSQANTRPQSRQNGLKSVPHRSRSGSPGGRAGAARSQEERTKGQGTEQREEEEAEEPSPAVESAMHRPTRNPPHDFIVNGVQPFTKQKAYRPISFNPRPSPTLPSLSLQSVRKEILPQR